MIQKREVKNTPFITQAGEFYMIQQLEYKIFCSLSTTRSSKIQMEVVPMNGLLRKLAKTGQDICRQRLWSY